MNPKHNPEKIQQFIDYLVADWRSKVALYVALYGMYPPIKVTWEVDDDSPEA